MRNADEEADGTEHTFAIHLAASFGAISGDGGRPWSKPRFEFTNAPAPAYEMLFMNHLCSDIDAFVDCGEVHMFVPHRWRQLLHLRVEERGRCASCRLQGALPDEPPKACPPST